MSEEDYSIDYENQCVAAWAADGDHYTEYRLNFLCILSNLKRKSERFILISYIFLYNEAIPEHEMQVQFGPNKYICMKKMNIFIGNYELSIPPFKPDTELSLCSLKYNRMMDRFGKYI